MSDPGIITQHFDHGGSTATELDLVADLHIHHLHKTLALNSDDGVVVFSSPVLVFTLSTLDIIVSFINQDQISFLMSVEIVIAACSSDFSLALASDRLSLILCP